MDDQTCAACGTTAPSSARFCPQCGTAFEPRAADAEAVTTSTEPVTTTAGSRLDETPSDQLRPADTGADATATMGLPSSPHADPTGSGAAQAPWAAPTESVAQPPWPPAGQTEAAAAQAPWAAPSGSAGGRPPWEGPAGPGQWPPSAAPATSERRRGNGLAAALALIGAVLVAAGVFLPWADLEGESLSGWSISDDAKVQLLIGVGCLLLGVLLIVGVGRALCRLALLGAGSAVAVITVVDMLSVQDENAEIGAGLIVLLVAAGAVLLGSVLARPSRT